METTRDQIASAVLEIGFDERLTFGLVARKLNISESTLYRHVGSRKGLVSAGLDLAFRGFSWPQLSGDWPVMLKEWGLSYWHMLAEYPLSASHLASGTIPDSAVRLADEISVHLVTCGFSVSDAVLAIDMVGDLVVDNRRTVDTFSGEGVPGERNSRAGLAELWETAGADSPDNTDLSADDWAAVRLAMSEAIHCDPLVWFTYKLDIVIAGISAVTGPR